MTQAETEELLERLTKRFDGVVLTMLAEAELAGDRASDTILALTASMADSLARVVGVNLAIPEPQLDAMLAIMKTTALKARQKAVERALAIAFTKAEPRKETDRV